MVEIQEGSHEMDRASAGVEDTHGLLFDLKME
jgi:hypothetical protein